MPSGLEKKLSALLPSDRWPSLPRVTPGALLSSRGTS